MVLLILPGPSRFLRAYGLGFLSYLSPRLFSLLISKAKRKRSSRNRDVLPAVSTPHGSLLPPTFLPLPPGNLNWSWADENRF